MVSRYKGTPSAARARLVAVCQGSYYVASGVWPLLHMRSFEFVTGPKTDRWLVRTVGVLVAVIGAVQLRAARREPDEEIRLLSIGSALGLAAIDVVYWRRGTISTVYLLDAAAELAIVAGWLLSDSQPPDGDVPAGESRG